jgi:hypothetical protein
MGTRSTIALEFADGTVEQVYCHWDGYLAHNGKILAGHYINPFKLKELLALGGFSSLEATVEGTKATAYHSARGEELMINKFKDFEDYKANHQYEEYEYILRQVDGKAVWFVADHDNVYITLKQAFIDEQDRIAQEETAE